MTEAAGILATFSDLRIVKGRKVAQLVFEVALEQADAALRILGGVPMPDREQWVGIAPVDGAKITAGSASSQPAGPPPPTGEPDEGSPATPSKPRQHWADMPASQRAGIMCADPRFWPVLGAASEDEACRNFRARCGVDSRTELSTDRPGAIKVFETLETEYLAIKGWIPRP